MKRFFRRSIAAAATAAIAASAFSAVHINASARWEVGAYLGDLNGDLEVNAADLVLLAKHLKGAKPLTLENSFAAENRLLSLDGDSSLGQYEYFHTADINLDGYVDIFDFIRLRELVTHQNGDPVYVWEDDIPEEKKFIAPPVYDLYGSMPSQGASSVVAFYVDFPDCPYPFTPDLNIVREALFGEENTRDTYYPFDSVSAFFSRSSKGSVDVQGDVYRYTTKNAKSYYEGDPWHVKLIDELIGQFDGSVDFSKYDSDSDGTIDAILVSVPTDAGDDDWWPAAGIFGGDRAYRADRMNIGHVIVGNAQIESDGNHSNFVSSYVHEMGHCMGLPDYYLYNSTGDFQGLHGSAGFEMMDDAICDFGAASKLQLGWYTEDQVNIYDPSSGSQTFTLFNAQTDSGNCVIIPRGQLGDKYRSEYFIIEYATLDRNNKDITRYWWKKTGSGVRIYHVEATESGDFWYNTFLYSSGNDEATNYNKGRRFIRLVAEGTDSTDNFFHAGDVVNSSVNGFCWYDNSGYETVGTGIKITIGQLENDSYTITVSAD